MSLATDVGSVNLSGGKSLSAQELVNVAPGITALTLILSDFRTDPTIDNNKLKLFQKIKI